MLKELSHEATKLLSTTITAIGIGTIAAIGVTFAIAGWQRQHAKGEGDSKDHRETAYQSLVHAVDRFTRQDDAESPMRLRSDWATMAHALEVSEELSREITTKTQRKIWAVQLEYCQRVMLSELKTQEAFLESLAEDGNALSRFNHRPAERHVALVMRWVLRLAREGHASKDALSAQELARISERGLPRLAEEIRLWRIPVGRDSGGAGALGKLNDG